MLRRITRLSLASIVVLIALAPTFPVLADPPDQGHEQGEYEFVVPEGEACAFPVGVAGWYNVHWTNMWDSAGQFDGVKWQSNTHETLTNMETGQYIIGHYAGAGSEDFVSLPGGVSEVRVGLPILYWLRQTSVRI
jgi:hypothetical protein